MFVKLAIFAYSMAVAMAAWHGPLAGGSPADQYPAGVNPQSCPNYPHCDNPAVAVSQGGGWNGGWNGGAHAGAWNGAGAGGGWNGGHAGGWNGGAGAGGGWNNGGWNGDHGAGGWNQNGLDQDGYTGDGDYRGEGLAESGAYGDVSQNYNSDGHNGGGWNGGNSGGWNGGAVPGAYGHAGHAAQLPAGVDPHSCPNYPFCH